jgi:hypothetical protein
VRDGSQKKDGVLCDVFVRAHTNAHALHSSGVEQTDKDHNAASNKCGVCALCADPFVGGERKSPKPCCKLCSSAKALLNGRTHGLMHFKTSSTRVYIATRTATEGLNRAGAHHLQRRSIPSKKPMLAH